MATRGTESEYIEMTNRGLEINKDSIYDVIPADYPDDQAKSTPSKIADDAPVSCTPPAGRQITQRNIDRDQVTVKHVGGSKWRTHFRLGIGAALVFLSVGITLVIIYTVYAEWYYLPENQSEPPAGNSGTFNKISSTIDIPKRVTATITTDAEIGSLVLRLRPPFSNPFNFSYAMQDGILYPFRVNKRGGVAVTGILKAKQYKFIVRITDLRTDDFVDVTVVITCRDPSLFVMPTKSDSVGINSVSEIYTQIHSDSSTTIYSLSQVSKRPSIMITPPSTVLVSDFHNAPNMDAFPKTMFVSETPSSVLLPPSIYLTMGLQPSTDQTITNLVLLSSFPDFSTSFQYVKQLSVDETIMRSKFNSHYSSFLSTHQRN